MTDSETFKGIVNNRALTDIDRHVAERLRKLRKEARKTQSEVSALLEDRGTISVSYQQIQKYERGLNRISAGLLYEFAIIFNCSITEFYAGYSPTQGGS